jgi:hypothetical protein
MDADRAFVEGMRMLAHALEDMMTAEKEVVRGPDNRIVGTRIKRRAEQSTVQHEDGSETVVIED